MGHDPNLFEQILGDNTMSKKKILEESTIRRFMKLASIDALTENYFEKERPAKRERPLYREEFEEEDEFGAEEEAPVEDEFGGEEAFAGEEEFGAEEGGAAASVSEDAVREIVDAIAAAVSEVTGTAVEAVGGEEEAPVDDMGEQPPMDDVGAEPPMEEPAPPASRNAEQYQEAKADDDVEVQEEAADDEEAEVQEEAAVNKADLREDDDAEAKEDLEEAEDDADDKTEVKAESKKRKLTEEEMVAYVTKRVAKRISELAKKK